jgi:chromosome segregation ATPase
MASQHSDSTCVSLEAYQKKRDEYLVLEEKYGKVDPGTLTTEIHLIEEKMDRLDTEKRELIEKQKKVEEEYASQKQLFEQKHHLLKEKKEAEPRIKELREEVGTMLEEFIKTERQRLGIKRKEPEGGHDMPTIAKRVTNGPSLSVPPPRFVGQKQINNLGGFGR